jgi:hypothetical protein
VRRLPEEAFIFWFKRTDFWLKSADSGPKNGQNWGFDVTD